MIQGIDVSHWQDDNSTPQQVNFKKAKAAGAEFVFIKASEHLYVDADYTWNWDAAAAAGLLRGAYHFLRWDIPGLTQARFFCNDVLKGDWGELPLVADYEAPPSTYGGKTSYPSNALLIQFLQEVEHITGKKPMIYTSPGYWNINGKIKGSNQFDNKWLYFPLWVAHYTKADQPIIPKPWVKWTFWQHSATGNGSKFGTESKSVDLNWFNGDLVELYALAGQGEITPPAPPDLPSDPGVAIRMAKLEGQLEILSEWAASINFKG